MGFPRGSAGGSAFAIGRFYSLKFCPKALRSLWSVLGSLLQFIAGVLYMSFVSYFMLFQIVNTPQVISLFLLQNLVYFLWNAYKHILMFWGAVTYMLSGITLALTVRIGILEISWERALHQHSRPGKCHPIAPSSECGPRWDRMRHILWFFDDVDEHFLSNFLFGHNVRFIEKLPK